MSDSQKRASFQQRVFNEIKHREGTCNVIVIPVVVFRLCGDRNIALMLSHLIYWCDRGSNKDGFIWKSYREWMEETGLNRYQVDKASAWLKRKGFIEIRKGMVNGHPVLHYKIDQIKLLHDIGTTCRNEQKQLTKLANGIC